MRRRLRAPEVLAALVAALAGAALVEGCVAPLKIEATADPLAVLTPGSMAYLRLDGSIANALLPSILPPKEAQSLASVLARTRLVAIGVGPTAIASVAAGEDAAPGAIQSPFEACLIGDYPFRAASLSLGADPAWKREKNGFFNARFGLRAIVPGPAIALVSSGALEPMLAAARSPGPSPIPTRLAAFASRGLVIWAPEPFSRLAATLFGDSMEVPALGMLIAAEPLLGAEPAGLSADGSDVEYDTAVVFLMADADATRVYRPALRLAWYGVARGLLGDRADEALGATFVSDADLYLATGLRLSGHALAAAIVTLRQGLLAPPGSGGR